MGPTKPALLLSDLHLSAERPAPVAAFHAFARGPAQQASAVYILGDLFDAWLGDDQLADPLASAVAASIRSISDRGIPVFFARGNRDFLLGERFGQATGARLLPEPISCAASSRGICAAAAAARTRLSRRRSWT